jgi:AbrB family looped-hinge helix DNA binding protein
MRHGDISTMIVTIDAAGRLVIPGPIRREAALEPGVPLEVRWRDGIIEIEPQPIRVAIEKRGRLLVAKPKGKVRPLGTAAVDRTRGDISTGRGRR